MNAIIVITIFIVVLALVFYLQFMSSKGKRLKDSTRKRDLQVREGVIPSSMSKIKKPLINSSTRSSSEIGDVLEGMISGGITTKDVRDKQIKTLLSLGPECVPIIADRIDRVINSSQSTIEYDIAGLLCEIIGKIGGDRAFDILIRYLNKDVLQWEYEDIRGGAAKGLGFLGDSRAISDLKHFLENRETSDNSRRFIVESLEKLTSKLPVASDSSKPQHESSAISQSKSDTDVESTTASTSLENRINEVKKNLKDWYRSNAKGKVGGGICDDCNGPLTSGKTYLRPGNYLTCESCADAFLDADYIKWEDALKNLNSYFGPGIPETIQPNYDRTEMKSKNLINVLVFQMNISEPTLIMPEAICNNELQKFYKTEAKLGKYFVIGRKDNFKAASAFSIYKSYVNAGDIPDLGEKIGIRESKDISGINVIDLFFKPDKNTINAITKASTEDEDIDNSKILASHCFSDKGICTKCGISEEFAESFKRPCKD